MRRVIDDMVRPNGLMFSPDKSILYVADNGAKTVIAYRVEDDGSLERIKKIADMAVDGMTMDVLGNLYCTGGPRVVVFAPDGERRVVADAAFVDGERRESPRRRSAERPRRAVDGRLVRPARRVR